MDITDIFNTWVQECSHIEVYPMTVGVAIALAAAAFLLMCSGFYSASEIAFFGLSPSDISDIEEEKKPADTKILSLREDSERLLATILICNNLTNVSIVMLLNYCFTKTVNFGDATVLQFLVLTVLLTFLILLFGEVIPKIYGSQHTLAFSRFSAPIMCVLTKVFRPVSSLLVRSRIVTQKLVHTDTQSLTVDDLEKAMELTDSKDIEEESSMLQGIIRFGGEMAKEIMTSRMDIVDLDMKTPFPEVLKCIVDNNYSRIPVYQGTRDNIKGILYIKDLLPHLGKPAGFRWQSLIRPPYFVPETKMIDDLLRDFQANKVHIAIVVDEFGGTSGIVTMEDIIEEIVGEINDEYDEEEKSYRKQPDGSYVFEGKTLLADFIKIFDLDDDYFKDVEGEADTLAGLLLEIKGEFPSLHERIVFGSFTFEVMKMDERRIVEVKVEVKTEEVE